jgi:hypothetical protein
LEFERGFIGPSVYSYYLGRFGLESDRDRNKDDIEKARKQFDEQYECSIVAVPSSFRSLLKETGIPTAFSSPC